MSAHLAIKPTSADLRQLRRDNLSFPVALRALARAEWPPVSMKNMPVMVWRSRSFLVCQYEEGAHTRLSVNRCEWSERGGGWRQDISWDDLQRLKAEAGYGDRWAVEVYPADADVVNVANMRHIWLLDAKPEFAW